MRRHKPDGLDGPGFDAGLGSIDGDARSITDPCEHCEAKPSATLSFTDVSPRVIGSKNVTFTGTWCQGCARAVGRNIQTRTISRGWFGLTSWLATIKAAIGNASGLRQASKLDSEPTRRTMGSGRPVVTRPEPIALTLIVVFIASAAYLFVTNPTRKADDLKVGDCITLPADTTYIDTVETIACDEKHDLEVFAVGSLDIDSNDYSQWYRLNRVADEACLAAFQDYVGVAWEQSSLDYSYFTPTREGWFYGGEGYQCLLESPSGPTSGSARGSGR